MKDTDILVPLGKTELDINEIKLLIPHRYPMLLVDRVINLDVNKISATGIKSVSFNEPQFQGHFPQRPVMPGVMTIEAMAQTAAVVAIYADQSLIGKIVFFMSIENAKFRRPVEPGDSLHLNITMLRRRGMISKFDCVGMVNGKVVTEAQITAMIVDEDR